MMSLKALGPPFCGVKREKVLGLAYQVGGLHIVYFTNTNDLWI
jgi:hypothetical protein